MNYDTPHQYLRKLRIERVKTYLKYLGLSASLGLTIFIIYICLTSGNDTQKINECLEKHTMKYCNKEVK